MHAPFVVNKIADSNAAAKSVPKEKINKIHTYIIIYCIAGPVERIADLSQLRSTNICIMKQGTTKQSFNEMQMFDGRQQKWARDHPHDDVKVFCGAQQHHDQHHDHADHSRKYIYIYIHIYIYVTIYIYICVYGHETAELEWKEQGWYCLASLWQPSHRHHIYIYIYN